MADMDLGEVVTTVHNPFENIGNIFSGLAGLVNTGYNIWSNKRDFDYQKALQQQIFEREDTAIQRRMNDLKAAGINPNLAAGSAASPGSVVGRSNTPDVNIGSVLDYLQANNILKQQKEQIKILQYQKEGARMKNENDAWNYDMNQDWIRYLHGRDFTWFSPKLQAYFDYTYNNLKNSSEILQKENNWFTANQIINSLGNVAKDISYFTPSFVKRLK